MNYDNIYKMHHADAVLLSTALLLILRLIDSHYEEIKENKGFSVVEN